MSNRLPSEEQRAQDVIGERIFDLLVNGVVDYAIFMLDLGGRIITWNTGAQRIKGYTAEEILGQHFSIFYTPEDRAAGIPDRALALAVSEGRYENEGDRVRRDGSRFCASVVIDPIYDSGALVAFAKITRDVTERVQAEKALEQARSALAQSQKMEAIGQLTGGIAHDFNNLLTVIINALDILGRQAVEPRLVRILDNAKAATERGAALTQQLLAFARRQPLQPESHFINRLISDFGDILRHACGETVAIDLDLDPRLGASMIDAAQFEQVLLNLAINARDAMPDGGRVIVSTGLAEVSDGKAKILGVAPGTFAVVTVRDTGEGMAPEVLSRAFDPFFTTKGVGRGTGLGLSQVYGFITQSGGHVEIRSAPGQGTTITLHLPAGRSTEGDIMSNAEKIAAIAGSGTILVVEDNAIVQLAAVALLEDMGYRVLSAMTGAGALAILNENRSIDVLFTDVVMPGGMNGVELAKEAVRLRPGMPVLLASGYPETYLSGTEDIPGPFAFIGKPYRWDTVQTAIRTLRERARKGKG